jgi:phosphotransferase system enzyme I (PtsI)
MVPLNKKSGANMKLIGIGASEGVAFGKVFKLDKVIFELSDEKTEMPEKEIIALRKAIETSEKQIDEIKAWAVAHLSTEEAAIFDVHLAILNDPELMGQTCCLIQQQHLKAEKAYYEIAEKFIGIFETMDNEYMKERAADIKDVSRRVLANLLQVALLDPTDIKEEVIIVADDLTPSDTAQLDKRYAKGFVTQVGGRTSHSAIMARSLEIPAVVGIKGIFSKVAHGDTLMIDGSSGFVIINPTADDWKEFEEKKADIEKKKDGMLAYRDQSTLSKDGYGIELAANIGSVQDLEGVLQNGAEGIGLFRTEFLFMGKKLCPDEELQYEAYKTVLESMGDKPVVIRTLDVGGDKEIDYIQVSDEMNPFLGHRAIRLCLDRQDIFNIQLRALLRASIHGNLKIMFPMIATLDEYREAKKMLEACKVDLLQEGYPVSEQIEVGIMVEIPSTAVLADQFAKEVDFFSIGTNDLIQYTFAADRINEKVAYLYQPFNPALLRMIKMVVDASHSVGKWTGMCGEMAGDIMSAPLLLGLGLDELSMSANCILPIRKLMADINKKDMEQLAKRALQCGTSDEVLALIKEYINL